MLIKMDDLYESGGRKKLLNEVHSMVCLPSIENVDGKPLSLSSSWNGWGCHHPKRPFSAFPNGFHKNKSKKPFGLPLNLSSSTTDQSTIQKPNSYSTTERRITRRRLTRSVSIPNGFIMCNDGELENERKTSEPLSPLEKSSKAKFMIGDMEEGTQNEKLHQNSTVTAGMILKVQPGKYAEDINNQGYHFSRKTENDRSILYPEATRGYTSFHRMSLSMRNSDDTNEPSTLSLLRPNRLSCPESFGNGLDERTFTNNDDLIPKMRRWKLSEVCPSTDIVLPRASTAIKSLSDLKDGLPRDDIVPSEDVLTNRIESWLDGVEKPTEKDGEEEEELEEDSVSEVSLIRL
ncbi:uncharacterized protein [Apostichopus japonicus]|uniref:uncharacterized protein n=1 Tax=Stichopus japonicus TaxID=307972 RepID=UPI003AB71B4B